MLTVKALNQVTSDKLEKRRQHESTIEKQQERLNGNENNGAAITSIS